MTGRSPVGEAMLVTIKNIIATEGPRALFKGALFRIAWIAPLGAMNFAGYELAKRAMGGDENSTTKSEDAMKVATTTTQRHSAPASATISTSHTPTKSSAAAVSSSRTDLAKLQNNKQKRADVPEEDENVDIEEEQLPSGPQYPSEEDFGDFFDDNDDIKKDDDERKSK